MNKRFITFILITAVSGLISISAQRPNGAGRYIQTLPVETQTAIAELAGTFQAERAALTVQMRNGSISRQNFQAKQTDMSARHRAAILALLTPEQRTEWEADQATWTQQRNIRRQAFMSTYFERMTTDMKLTPAKKASLKTLMDEHMATMQPIQGQGRMQNISVRDEERANLDTQVKELLTRDEYQIFKSYMDEHQAQGGPRMQGQGQGQGRGNRDGQPQQRPRRQN